jgi:DNA primase large subunit
MQCRAGADRLVVLSPKHYPTVQDGPLLACHWPSLAEAWPTQSAFDAMRVAWAARIGWRGARPSTDFVTTVVCTADTDRPAALAHLPSHVCVDPERHIRAGSKAICLCVYFESDGVLVLCGYLSMRALRDAKYSVDLAPLIANARRARTPDACRIVCKPDSPINVWPLYIGDAIAPSASLAVAPSEQLAAKRMRANDELFSVAIDWRRATELCPAQVREAGRQWHARHYPPPYDAVARSRDVASFWSLMLALAYAVEPTPDAAFAAERRSNRSDYISLQTLRSRQLQAERFRIRIRFSMLVTDEAAFERIMFGQALDCVLGTGRRRPKHRRPVLIDGEPHWRIPAALGTLDGDRRLPLSRQGRWIGEAAIRAHKRASGLVFFHPASTPQMSSWQAKSSWAAQHDVAAKTDTATAAKRVLDNGWDRVHPSSATKFYPVPFETVSELVRNRSVAMRRGKALVPWFHAHHYFAHRLATAVTLLWTPAVTSPTAPFAMGVVMSTRRRLENERAVGDDDDDDDGTANAEATDDVAHGWPMRMFRRVQRSYRDGVHAQQAESDRRAVIRRASEKRGGPVSFPSKISELEGYLPPCMCNAIAAMRRTGGMGHYDRLVFAHILFGLRFKAVDILAFLRQNFSRARWAGSDVEKDIRVWADKRRRNRGSRSVKFGCAYIRKETSLCPFSEKSAAAAAAGPALMDIESLGGSIAAQCGRHCKRQCGDGARIARFIKSPSAYIWARVKNK